MHNSRDVTTVVVGVAAEVHLTVWELLAVIDPLLSHIGPLAVGDDRYHDLASFASQLQSAPLRQGATSLATVICRAVRGATTPPDPVSLFNRADLQRPAVNAAACSAEAAITRPLLHCGAAAGATASVVPRCEYLLAGPRQRDRASDAVEVVVVHPEQLSTAPTTADVVVDLRAVPEWTPRVQDAVVVAARARERSGRSLTAVSTDVQQLVRWATLVPTSRRLLALATQDLPPATAQPDVVVRRWLSVCTRASAPVVAPKFCSGAGFKVISSLCNAATCSRGCCACVFDRW